MSQTRREFARSSLYALGALALVPGVRADNHLNRRIVLASRPEGMPTTDNFRLETAPVPEPGEGEVGHAGESLLFFEIARHSDLEQLAKVVNEMSTG